MTLRLPLWASFPEFHVVALEANDAWGAISFVMSFLALPLLLSGAVFGKSAVCVGLIAGIAAYISQAEWARGESLVDCLSHIGELEAGDPVAVYPFGDDAQVPLNGEFISAFDVRSEGMWTVTEVELWQATTIADGR